MSLHHSRPTRVSAIAALAAFALLVPAMAQSARPVEAEVRPREIRMGEAATLRIRLRDTARSAEPDLTPLERDFEIEDVARVQRQSIMNGVRDESVDWELVLRPRSEGTLTVPALAVGAAHTEAMEIVVAARAAGPARAAENTTAAPILVLVDADRPTPYEQERVVLRIRLLADAPIVEGTLGEPQIEGAAIERLGGDRRIEETAGGRRYQGVERSYAVVPSQAGTLRVPPVTFEAELPDTRSSPRRLGYGRGLLDDFFADPGFGFGGDVFDRLLGRGTRRVAVRSEPLQLEVRPRPPESTGHWWLPAREVRLEESWEGDPSSSQVGETLTRRITLEAEGAGLMTLPDLALPNVDGVKQYAEAPRGSEDRGGAVRVQEASVIPTRAGPLTLPPIEVHWWDVEADAPRVARLPGRTLEVAGSPSAAAAASPPPAEPAREPAPRVASTPSQAPAERPSRLLWASGGAFLALGSILGGLWLACTPPIENLRRRRGARRALRRACRQGDAPAAERALRGLRALEDPAVWSALEEPLASLSSARYSPTASDWDGPAFWTAYRAAAGRRTRRAASRGPAAGGLPPLYPHEAPAPRG